MTSTGSIPLSTTYRRRDFFEFHERDPQGVAEQIVGQTLRQSGFSQAKAQVLDGSLPLERGLKNQTPEEEIRNALLNIRGIGPWTVDYALLRGFGWLDGLLHGDTAVRHGLQKLLGSEDRVTAAHLWALKAADQAR